MPSTRRDLLQRSLAAASLLGGLGLLPQAAQAAFNTAAFESKSAAEALKALGVGAPVESKDVSLSGPDIADNGAEVSVAFACALPGVKRLLLLIEKNPSPLSAVFDVSAAIEPSFATRVKMSQSSNVLVVALMADGRALFTLKDIKVTLGGCGA